MERIEDRLFWQCWKWVDENQHNFSLNELDDKRRVLDLIKPLGELALLCGIVFDRSNSNVRAKARNLLDFCWSELDEGNVILDLLNARPDIITLISLYSNFFRFGYENNKLTKEVKLVASTPAYMGIDLPAWRRLDLLHGLISFDMATHEDLQTVFQTSWAAACHPPWTISLATAYGLTHSVFYMTDFGRLKNLIPENVAEHLLKWLPEWESMYMRELNYDISGEMAISRKCITGDCDAFLYCTATLNASLKDGAIPGPSDGPVNLTYAESNPSRIYFFRNYHTTLVACIASFMYSTAFQG